MRINDPIVRRSQRVLAMLHELHKQGYQNLGVYSGYSPSGGHWRCMIAPVHHLRVDNGGLELLQSDEALVAHHTSGTSGNHYFGWEDAKHDTARELAAKFLQRFPALANAGMGRNYVYAGWFVEVLGRSEEGELPVAFGDYLDFNGALKTTGHGEIPLPPLG